MVAGRIWCGCMNVGSLTGFLYVHLYRWLLMLVGETVEGFDLKGYPLRAASVAGFALYDLFTVRAQG